MALVKQGGGNPNAGKVVTTMGLREPRPPVCEKCKERKNQLYTRNANGQIVCADCAGSFGKGVLVATGCEDEDCACGKVCDDERDPS